jgi:signal transduction histidine kinase/DNA-binding response OmpR family regulator
MHQKNLATLVIFLCLINNTYAQDSLESKIETDSSFFIIYTIQHTYLLKDYAQFFKDPNDEYQLTDFLDGKNQKLFKPINEFSKYGAILGAESAWTRISIENNRDDRILWQLELFGNVDSIEGYIVSEDKSIDTFKIGRLISYERTKSGLDILNDAYDFRNPIFFTIKKGEKKDIYYKTAPGAMKRIVIFLRLKSMEAAYKTQHRSHFVYIKSFFNTGLFWMLFVYNFIIYLFYRNKGYLYLSLYIFCFSLPTGFPPPRLIIKEWFSNVPFLYDINEVVFMPFIFIFLNLFMREYLNTKKNYPKIDFIFKVMIGISFVYLVVAVGSYLIDGGTNYEKSILYLTIEIIIQMSLFIVVSIRLSKSKSKYKSTEIRFLVASIVVLLLFSLFDRLPEVFGWIEFNQYISSLLRPISLSGIGVLFQIIIWTMGLGASSRNIAQEKELLEEQDAFKSQFFVNISHEFRTPLTLVLGPIQQIIDKTTDSKDKELLMMAHRNANRQLQLINELLDLSKLEANKMQLQVSENDFVPVLRGIVYSYDSLAIDKEISLEMKNPTEPVMLYFDQEKMEKIFYNLLTNAFKFTPSGGTIRVSMIQKKKSVVITVSDTGKGIAQDQLENIFNRFFQADAGKESYYESSGIGLTLTKELVELHHGTINVKSQLGKRTTFFLEFPLGNKHLQEDEIVTREIIPLNQNLEASNLELKENVTVKSEEVTKKARSSKRPTLLIVEDNKDMRAFIRQKLESDYQIIEAFDGEEGIEKAIEHIPDLIISDVMMPKKNGYEVCKTLKTDVRTSHIPIVLLTAKAAQEEKIEGLETGADDYLTKPFDAKELLIRVQNLIAIREQLRQRFAASINLKPSEVTTNSIDAEFLQNAMQIVEINMESEDFNIETFTQKIGMSRSTLNRKLKALTNQTINQFIQSARLNRAADLIRQKSGTVAEIGFQTGFRSTAYFVKCFKDKFGVTPGKFE